MYHDLFLFIRQKREKKVPPSAGKLLFVFLFIGNFQLKGPCLNFFTETTSFMKQSAFQYKLERAFFGKKKKKKRETSLYRVIRQEKRNEADLKAQVS